MNNDTRPIGFFDSGVGGTSIWKEVIRLLPNENTIYLADSLNAPYGEKPVKQIIALSKKNTDLLLNMDCKLVVVACNTATTNAIKLLRSRYSIPFIGIEPAIKPAALKSQTKTIGILATKGTLSSELFAKTSELYSRNLNIIEVEGNGLVELIENGLADSPESETLLRKLLKPMLKAGIDYLVLGCSHYPYLINTIKKILHPKVSIIDSGEAVAKQTSKILYASNLLNSENQPAKHLFLSNKSPEVLKFILKEVEVQKKISYLDF